MSKSIFAFTSKDGKNDGRRNELLLNVFHLNLPFYQLDKSYGQTIIDTKFRYDKPNARMTPPLKSCLSLTHTHTLSHKQICKSAINKTIHP